MSRIVKLESENIQRIKAASFYPHKNHNVIAGKNGNGKSSLISTIFLALGGKKAMSNKPVRDGEETALARIETEDLIITRNWTNPETSYLKVETKNGAKIANPQSYLDTLVGTISFDPMEFVTMDSKKRLEVLKQVTGLSEAIDALDKEFKAAYDQRADYAREGKRIAGELEAFKNHPDQLIVIEDVESIKKEIEEIKQSNQVEEKRRRDHEQGEKYLGTLESKRADIQAQIEQLTRQVKELDAEIEKTSESLNDFMLKDFKSTAALEQKIYDSITLHSQNKDIQRKLDLVSQKETITNNWNEQQSRLEEIAKKKVQALQEAKMPIEGLNLIDNTVTYNGIPFEQLCSAEQIKISFAMVAAMNFNLRIAVIKNGSLLDEDSLAQVFEMADALDIQVFIETVKSYPDGHCIFIHDGEIVE